MFCVKSEFNGFTFCAKSLDDDVWGCIATKVLKHDLSELTWFLEMISFTSDVGTKAAMAVPSNGRRLCGGAVKSGFSVTFFEIKKEKPSGSSAPTP
jgi:hypothetical protein